MLSDRAYQGTSVDTLTDRIHAIQQRLRGFPDSSVTRAVYERVLLALTPREARLNDELRSFRGV